VKIRLTLNGEVREAEIEPAESLLSLLRRSGCLSVKYGCGSGDCGTCTVIADGRVVVSCIMLAAKANGRDIRTMEGWRGDRALEVLTEVFVQHAAVQCGYCTPGMILAARTLLAEGPDPSEETVRHALAGNLCRCTGYVKPVEAVLEAARRLRAPSAAPRSPSGVGP
jgi:aerobic-type carbon monoxide dehydrogenase small subunit (CoxS/CutS family)